MELEKNKLQVEDDKEIERDDSKDPITIDYYDRINHRWIKVDTTKEVARFMKADEQRTRRKQNQYNFYDLPFDEVFDSTKKENEKNEQYLIDESVEIAFEKLDDELMQAKKDEHQRTLIENSLCYLTPEQREVVEMAFYKNMSYREIANEIGIDKSSIYSRMKNAQKNIKEHIKNTEN
jgi:RNA polymerase sigma factor (sigma-70 family)